MMTLSNPFVEFICDEGRLVIEVHADRAPLTAANFLKYVDAGLFDGQTVFRIVTPSNDLPERRCDVTALQWGWRPKDARFDPALGRGWDPLDDIDALPFPPIPLETTQQTGLHHIRGSVSMGRDAEGNIGPHPVFYVNNTPDADFGGRRSADGQGFPAFARVVNGLDVLDRILTHAETHTWMQTPFNIQTVRRIAYE